MRLGIVAIVALSVAWSGSAHAQAWPQQPIKVVVGLAPGGLSDTITRIVTQPMSERLGQAMVVENRPGASGTIAAEMVARAPADGYTLLMGNLPQMVIVPAMTGTRYDPLKDFEAISVVGSNPFVLVVNAQLPIHTLGEFVAYVKARQGQLSYGSGGTGNGTHLSMAYFLKLAGLDMIHVPYKGGAPAMADLIAGHVPAMFASSSDAIPQVKAGTVRALAVSSGERSDKLPDVPTIAEQGFPTFKTITWNGLMAPAKTPKEIVNKLAAALAASEKEPAVLEHMANQGIDPAGQGPAHFTETIKTDIALWTEAIAASGVKGK
jgi:tripartite-type tricarboxylate transporter receptor subunit TctC